MEEEEEEEVRNAFNKTYIDNTKLRSALYSKVMKTGMILCDFWEVVSLWRVAHIWRVRHVWRERVHVVWRACDLWRVRVLNVKHILPFKATLAFYRRVVKTGVILCGL